MNAAIRFEALGLTFFSINFSADLDDQHPATPGYPPPGTPPIRYGTWVPEQRRLPAALRRAWHKTNRHMSTLWFNGMTA